MRIAAGLLLSVALSLFALCAGAQSYPSKPIRMVIPYPPGGVDVVIRLLLPVMDQELGQPTVIDYRPGAGGLIGQEYIARSEPDGYTLLATASNPWVVAPAVRKKTPYDPIEDFTPITLVTQGVNIIVANPAFPADDVRGLIEYARKNPGKVSWATSGLGSSWHLDGEFIKKLAGIDVLHVPYQGFGPMIPAMLSGRVPVGLITYQIARGLLQSGKLKMIGILNTGNPALEALFPPGVQRVSEVLPQYESGASWVGIGGPAGLPRPIVERLNTVILKAIRQPDLQARLKADLVVATGSTPEEFAALVARDYAASRKVVKEVQIPLLD